MKKMNKKDYLLISILGLFVIGFVLVLRAKGFAFGSYTDWINQHITIPEYFRALFYKDGTILPLFSFNFGMGQSIYYYAYYGLLSPLILGSYFFPFLSMATYIQLISILSIMLSIFLLYKWLNGKYGTNVAFIVSIIFTLAGPLIYQSHRQIMFISYMPFLLWALIAVDKYFEQKKAVSLIISTFLLIMTSFYFSIPSIIVIGLYTLYKILSNKKLKLESFNPLLKIIFFVIIAILLSGLLLIPTFYALIVGRSETTVSFQLWQLLIPKLDYKLTFYSAYSMGMTFIYVVALVYAGMTKKKENLFLVGTLLLCMGLPIINYLLNGFMYLDGKAFIPFLPLACLMLSEFMRNLFNKKINIIKLYYLLIPVILIMLYTAISYSNRWLLITDIVTTTGILFLILKTKRPWLIYLPVIVIGLFTFIFINTNERYVHLENLDSRNSAPVKELLKFVDKPYYRTSIFYERTDIFDEMLWQANKFYSPNQYSTTIYSSSVNQNYLNFIRNDFKTEVPFASYAITTQTNNLLFNIYSSTEYLIAKEPLNGYRAIAEAGGLTLYQNDMVMPFGYATNKIMSLREFGTLSGPQVVDALLNYTIVDKALDNVGHSSIQEIHPSYHLISEQDLTYELTDERIFIQAGNNGKMQLELAESLKDEILFISFKMHKEKVGGFCSTDIKINGTNNSLSCSNWKYHNHNYDFNYVIAPDSEIKTLDISFTKGDYEINDIKFYTLNYNTIKGLKNQVDAFVIDEQASTNNKLVGNINVKEDGYFNISIPYQKKGFTITVDGEKVMPLKVDNGFLGFEISKGIHSIEIKYVPPFFITGVIISAIGSILLLLVALYPKIEKPLHNLLMHLRKAYDWVSIQIKIYLITNRGYVYLFFSMLILDVALRLFYYSSIKFYGWWRFVPNFFSVAWIVFILLLTRYLKGWLGKSIFIISYVFSLIMFLVHAIFFAYFKTYFDFSVMTLAGEGFAYFDTILQNINWWVVMVFIISIYLTIRGLSLIHHSLKSRITKVTIITVCFIILHALTPLLLGSNTSDVEWDDWRKPRTVYNSFNDNNKSMMLAGMYEYNLRNLYINFIRNNKTVTEEEKTILAENFNNSQLNTPNQYTGIFDGKNLILVQLESIDTFLITEKIMPVTYNLMKNSINFTDHYSFTSGGGSTFNSEFMVNTGYSNAYNYNLSAYAFSKNNYYYSLPNLFKRAGYSTQAFHMNSSEYYSRGANYTAFGYHNYYGLKDLKSYKNNEYYLDRELIANPVFNAAIFKEQSLSYIITYTAHMPYKTTKGNCSMLTEETGLTEFECLKLQAGETDNFMKLLLQGLEANNMLENTVIAVFSDHYLYTLEDDSLLEKYKDTSNNLINKTPFFIWSNGEHKHTIKSANSQLDILPTLLNLFGFSYYPNYYLGGDILANNFVPLVFFQDGDWYNGSTYVANGEYQSGKHMKTDKINEFNTLVRRKMKLNDAVIKSDYFKTITKK